MAALPTIKLSKSPGTSWGFRLQGGKDFATPLCIQKVNVGSVAAQAGLQAGDVIVTIAGVDAFTLRHKEAQDTIVRAGNSFDVVIQRGSQVWKPTITALPEVKTLSDGVPVATKTSLAATQKPFKPIGSRHNVSAAPFNEGLVLPAYNTPINIYSDDSIAETLSAQAEVLGKTGVMGINFKKYAREEKIRTDSPTYKLLHGDEEPERRSRPPLLPVNDDDDGQQGYYNINDKLYCDTHAKQAARVNPPAPNMEPVIVPPGSSAPFGAVTAQQAGRMKVPSAFQQNAAPAPSHAPVPAPFKAPPPGGVRILPAQTTNAPTPFKPEPEPPAPVLQEVQEPAPEPVTEETYSLPLQEPVPVQNGLPDELAVPDSQPVVESPPCNADEIPKAGVPEEPAILLPEGPVNDAAVPAPTVDSQVSEPVSSPQPEPVVSPQPVSIASPQPEPAIAPQPEPVSAPQQPVPVVSPQPEPVLSPQPEPVIAQPQATVVEKPVPTQEVPKPVGNPAPVFKPAGPDVTFKPVAPVYNPVDNPVFKPVAPEPVYKPIEPPFKFSEPSVFKPVEPSAVFAPAATSQVKQQVSSSSSSFSSQFRSEETQYFSSSSSVSSSLTQKTAIGSGSAIREPPAPVNPAPVQRAPVSAPAPPKSFAPAPAPAPAPVPVAAAPRPAPSFGTGANPQGFGAPARDVNVRSHIPKKGQAFEWPPRRAVKVVVESDEPQPHPPAWAPAGEIPSVPKPVKTPGPLPKRPPLLPTPPPPKDYDTIVMGSTSPAQLVPIKPALIPDAVSPAQKVAQASPKPAQPISQPISKPVQASPPATKPVPPASQLSPKSVQPAPKPVQPAPSSPRSPQSAAKPSSICPKPCAPIFASQPVIAPSTPKPAQPTPKPVQPAPKPVQPAPKPVQAPPKPVQFAPKPAQTKPTFAPAPNPAPQNSPAAPPKTRFRNPAPTLINISSSTTTKTFSKSVSSSVSQRQGGISLSPPKIIPVTDPMPTVKLDSVPVKFSDPLPPAQNPLPKPISQPKSQQTPTPVAGFKSVSAPIQNKPVVKPQRPTGPVPAPAPAPTPALSNLPASAPALSESVAPKPVPSNTPAPAGDVPAPMSFASAPAPAPAPFAPVSAPVYAPAPVAPVSMPIKPAPPGLGGPGPIRGVLQAPGHRTAPRRGRGIMNQASGSRIPVCSMCSRQIRGPFVSALGKTWCPDHFICATTTCKRNIIDMGFVEEKGGLYCENCYESFMAPICGKCDKRIKGDCLNAVGKQFHPECFCCAYCGRVFGSGAFYLEDGLPYCETDWNDLFTTKCVGCNFPIEAGDRWVEALNNNYHSQCFKCSKCHQNLEGQSFFAKGGKPFCKTHAQRGIL